MGDMKPTDPAVLVNTSHEAHFIGGLVGNSKRDPSKYVGDSPDYRVKHYHSFTDALLTGVTLGIYTPTTTKYYVPYGTTGVEVVKREKPIFGVRAGINLSMPSLIADIYPPTSGKIGFSIGALLDQPLSKKWHIMPGFNFKILNFKKNYSSEGDIYGDIKFIQIPILASYRIQNIHPDVELQINAGPYAGMAISASIDGQSSGRNSFDAGLQIGAGVTYKKHFFAGLSLDLSPLDYHISSNDYHHYDANMSSSALSLTIGYNF